MAEPQASSQANKHASTPKADENRIIIRPYPKAVFFYPTAICTRLCGVLASTGWAQPRTLGFLFMCVFLFNLMVSAFEFTRYVSVAVVLSMLVVVLLGVQLNEQFGLVHVASFALVFVGVRLVNTQPPEGVD